VTYNLRALIAAVEERLSSSPQAHLRDLAKDLGIERHTIERAVREVRGISYREYRREILLGKAISLLQDTGNLPEKQIAFSVGYRSPAAFSRFIRSATGMTPTAIRRMRIPPL